MEATGYRRLTAGVRERQNMQEIMAAIIGVLGSILAWYLSSRDLKKQDHDNKRREIRLQYLIDAYRALESSCHRNHEPDNPYAITLESAIADVQLFGTDKQVRLAAEFAKSMANAGEGTVEDLLDDLRSELRARLDLEPVLHKRMILRFTPKTPEPGGVANPHSPSAQGAASRRRSPVGHRSPVDC